MFEQQKKISQVNLKEIDEIIENNTENNDDSISQEIN